MEYKPGQWVRCITAKSSIFSVLGLRVGSCRRITEVIEPHAVTGPDHMRLILDGVPGGHDLDARNFQILDQREQNIDSDLTGAIQKTI